MESYTRSLLPSAPEAIAHGIHGQLNQLMNKVVSSIVKEDLHTLVKDTDLAQWKGILAILCTYAKSEDFAILSGLLGDRLAAEKDIESATLCYICAGNVEKTVQMWAENTQMDHAALQALIEKVSVLRRAINYQQPLGGILANKYRYQ